MAEHQLSITRACSGVSLARSAYYRKPADQAAQDAPVIDALNAVVARHPRWGFWKCNARLALDGHGWNHKRIHRVYCAMNLNLPRRTRKRVPVRDRQTMEVPRMPNHTWSMDFMSDALYSGRRFRTLNVLDEGVREGLDIVIDTSLTALRVVRVMDQLKAWRGLPKAIRCDNGPEFLAQAFADWCREHDVELRYIQPGKPNQNAYIERFNRTYRQEVLGAYLFDDLEQVREITADWLRTYNEERPHDALGRIPPTQFREALPQAGSSTDELSS